MTLRRLAGAVGLVLVATGLTACSQVAALAPVGGNGLAEVRFATIDVLLDQNVELMRAPVCTLEANGADVTCAGTTVDGRDITARSSIAAGAQLEVAIGADTVFRGPLADVLDSAARG